MKRLFLCFGLLLMQCTTPTPRVLTQGMMPDGLCYLDTIAPSIRVDLAYAGHENFVGHRLDGYEGTRAIVRCDTALALAKAADLFARQSLGLIVHDAYRPRRALLDVARWGKTSDVRMKASYFPNISKADIFEHRYIGDVSEHSWGIAVDVSLFDLKTGKLLDMGGHFDLLDPSSATMYAGLTSEQRRHRDLLLNGMQACGFKNYSKEWWHYWLADAPHVLSYDFVIQDDLKSSSEPESTPVAAQQQP